MTSFDRQVRAQIYRLFVSGAKAVDAGTIADSRDWGADDVEASLRRLRAEHRIETVGDTSRVAMAHPFSGVETDFRSIVDGRSWYANCAWDALALLALLGDGEAMVGDLKWTVEDGVVRPDGVVHLLVPARSFWDDVGYT